MSNEWRELAERELAGRKFDDVLVTKLREGLQIQPVYTGPQAPDVAGAPGALPFTRGSRASDGSWRRTQRYRAEEVEAIHADLAAGTSGVWLEGPVDLVRALRGVDLGATLIAHDGDGHSLLDALAGRQAPHLVLGLDPLGAYASYGVPIELRALTQLLERATREGRNTARTALVSTTPHHRAGADAALELGCALATAAEYLRVVDAPARFAFAFSVGSDVFLEIAKLRAARWAWAKMLVACGATNPPPMWIHAETSRRALSTVDPWTNMLRVTGATFAAAVGGADSIASASFDEAIGVPDALGRRVARNTSIVLYEESHLGEVIDPAGGSYYLEQLTRELAIAGWKQLQAIEAAGGMKHALESGWIAERIAASWAVRRRAIAQRKAPLTGVSEYAELEATRLSRAPWSEAPQGALPIVRDAEDFERLRGNSVGPVFLANLGSRSEYSARESFARDFFGAGGIAVVSSTAATAAERVSEYDASGAKIACICGADPRYAAEAEAEAAALKSHGAERVWLAGKHQGPGIDGNIYRGCDVVALLATLGGAR